MEHTTVLSRSGLFSIVGFWLFMLSDELEMIIKEISFPVKPDFRYSQTDVTCETQFCNS